MASVSLLLSIIVYHSLWKDLLTLAFSRIYEKD